jgi:uncharacterized protein (TIGR03066 family)
VRRLVMILMRGLTVGSVLLCLVFCVEASTDEAKTKELLVGKWKSEKSFKDNDVKITVLVELTKEGKLTVDRKGANEDVKLEGTYKVLDENTLEATLVQPAKKVTHKLTIELLTKTKLILKGEKADKLEFERVP